MLKASVIQVVDKKIAPITGPIILGEVGSDDAALIVAGLDYSLWKRKDRFHKDAVAIRKHPLDASVQGFLLGADGKVISEAGFVYYGQPKFGDAVAELVPSNPASRFHTQLRLKLGAMPQEVGRIALVSSVHEPEHHHIGMFVAMSLYLCRKDLEPVSVHVFRDFGRGQGSVILGEIFAADGKWQFVTAGDTVEGGLKMLCDKYGIEVKDE